MLGPIFVFGTLVSATTAAGAAVVDTWMLLFAGYDATTEEIFVRPNLGTEVRTARADGTHVNTYPLLLGARGGLYSTFRLAAGGIFPGLLTDNDRSYLYNGGTAARLAVGGVV